MTSSQWLIIVCCFIVGIAIGDSTYIMYDSLRHREDVQACFSYRESDHSIGERCFKYMETCEIKVKEYKLLTGEEQAFTPCAWIRK